MNRNLLLVGVLVVLLAGGSFLLKSRGIESTVDKDSIPETLPSYAFTNQRSVNAYTAVMQNPGAFEKIPCYCGCVNMDHGGGNIIRHKHNRDCFIKDDGTFEEHGAYCDLCQYIALDAYDMYQKGVELKDIRSAIEARYGNGRYGPGTNTPPVV